MSNLFTIGVRLAVASALVLMFAASCTSEQVVSGPNVVARWKPCRESTGGPTNRTVLEHSVWSDGKLIVDVKDNDYCGGTVLADPGYTVAGDTVQLRWTWKLGPEKAVTACACDHTIRFELSNLTSPDYKVPLVRVR